MTGPDLVLLAWDAYVDAGCTRGAMTDPRLIEIVKRFRPADRQAVLDGIPELVRLREWPRFRLACLDVWVIDTTRWKTFDEAALRMREIRHHAGMRGRCIR